MRNEIIIPRVQENGCKILLHLFNKRKKKKKPKHNIILKLNL
jgi:hypothetical protein